MTLEELELHSRRAIELLTNLGVRFAVVGGIAVSFQAIERLTKDLDLAVAVEDDSGAQAIVHSFSQLGYLIDDIFEHELTKRMATVRMISPGENPMYVDFLFATSGIENEIVDASEEGHLFSNINVRVAKVPSLIALKVLSARESRMRDIVDLQSLFEVASPSDIAEARHFLDLITERGYNRNKDLQKDLDGYIDQFKT
ncbi:MAG: nucleotidyl transferase AbiEii/AbiGii toxin family protein [Pyrinomonadaceae bacterium]